MCDETLSTADTLWVSVIRSACAAMLWEIFVAQLEVAGGSYREAALGTLLSLTNETLNAWTTICGFLGITSLYIYSMCAAVRFPCLTMSCCLVWNAFVVCVHFCNLSGAVQCACLYQVVLLEFLGDTYRLLTAANLDQGATAAWSGTVYFVLPLSFTPQPCIHRLLLLHRRLRRCKGVLADAGRYAHFHVCWCVLLIRATRCPALLRQP